ncbi:demethoxyubiquinone hydroxylase family protein [Emcibacter sp. SYSU 3D8]|uniref:demethoxyubiquinone hydroxylase family protein n=1 Tax=Emcibacter sp. SYSU 3D8 TaxID=3133969 RepID=UPI0031FEEFBA
MTDTPERLPGTLTLDEEKARMIRVDQAGEYGAVRIYEGQLAVLGARTSGAVIRRMAAQEARHLDKFDRLMTRRQVRPTLLSPVWHMAGFALGAATALIGEKAAMACTVAVEEVIDEHYSRQAERLEDGDPELKTLIEECRAEEIEHKAEAEEQGAREAIGYPVLTGAIKTGARLAIWLSSRV